MTSGAKITDFKSQILLNTSTMHTRFVFDEIAQLNVWPMLSALAAGQPVTYRTSIPVTRKSCQGNSVNFSKSNEYTG